LRRYRAAAHEGVEAGSWVASVAPSNLSRAYGWLASPYAQQLCDLPIAMATILHGELHNLILQADSHTRLHSINIESSIPQNPTSGRYGGNRQTKAIGPQSDN